MPRPGRAAALRHRWLAGRTEASFFRSTKGAKATSPRSNVQAARSANDCQNYERHPDRSSPAEPVIFDQGPADGPSISEACARFAAGLDRDRLVATPAAEQADEPDQPDDTPWETALLHRRWRRCRGGLFRRRRHFSVYVCCRSSCHVVHRRGIVRCDRVVVVTVVAFASAGSF